MTPRADLDVLVVGAGPAGSFTATLAAKAGLSVLLVDKATFPRDKVCGCTLNGRVVEALAKAGPAFASLPSNSGAIQLHGFRLAHRGDVVAVPLHHHYALSRSTLDHALLEAAMKSGVEFRNATCLGVEPSAERIRVELRDDTGAVRTRSARTVVAADGLSSRLLGAAWIDDASYIGAGGIVATGSREYETGVLYMAVDSIGYVGAVRLEDGRLDLAAAIDRRAVAAHGGLAGAFRAILASAGFPRLEGLDGARLLGTPSLTRSPRTVARDRIFAVGDAAGYVEPFTGEGIGWALESAIALAPHLLAAARGDDSAMESYSRAIAAWTRRRQRGCRAIAWSLRHPPLIEIAMALFSEFPGFARSVVRRFDAAPLEAAS